MNFRQVSKRTLGEALWPLAGKAVSRAFFRGERGLILMFHYMGAPILKGVSEDLFLSLPEFTATLDFVRRSLHPLDPEEFLTLLEQRNLPPGATLLAFDDCHANMVGQALPELASRSLRACFFANPGLVNDGHTVPALELMDLCRSAPEGHYELHLPELTAIDISDNVSRAAAYHRLWPKILRSPSRQIPSLFDSIRTVFDVSGPLTPDARLASWESLQTLHDSGMLLGNHTMYHSTVNTDGIDQFTADIDSAYRDLENRFGPARRRTFCYPYGRAVDATSATTVSLRNLRTVYGFVSQGGVASATKDGLLNLHGEEAAYSVGAIKLAPLLAAIR